MKITLMLTEGCSHHQEARVLVHGAVAEAGVDADIEEVLVRTEDEARLGRVLGSPTIRIEGLDVEYADREPEEASQGCRYYNTPGGWKPVPGQSMIVRAIARAQGG